MSWNRNQGGTQDPDSWSNNGKGGITVSSAATIKAYTGIRKVGESTQVNRNANANENTDASGAMLFNFSLLATPVKGDYTTTAASKREHYVESRHYHIQYGVWEPPTVKMLQVRIYIL